MKLFLPVFCRKVFLTILILTSFLFHTQTIKAQQGRELDSLSLVGLYLAYYGETWTNHDGWMEAGVPINEWYGVSLNEDGTRVETLEMPNNNIVAEFPESVSDEAWLGAFALDLLFGDPTRREELIDVITQIFDIPGAPLGELEVLDLSNNEISGNIPIEIDQVTQLRYLMLSNNNFTGSVPYQIGNLENLEILDLGYNEFTGNIPPELGDAQSLTYLNLQQNDLSGSIPSDLGDLTNLQYLELRNNNLTGTLPSHLWDLTNLVYLSLRRNAISGSISSDISNLANLETLNLSENNFSGSIPDAFENLTLLKGLYLHGNNFSGTVPASIGEISGLMNLNISYNALTDLPELSNVWNAFICYNNYFTFEDFELNLYLQDNANEYSISPQYEFGSYRELYTQVYQPYSITISCPGEYNHYEWYRNGILYAGTTDSETLNFSSIQWEDAGDYTVRVTNDSVPSLELISNITTIHLQNNCVYADSMALVAFYNDLNGYNWTNNSNWLTGPIRTWHGIELSGDGCNVTGIDLPENNLDGILPEDIGTLTELTRFNLPGNQLSDKIPFEFWQLTGLIQIDLGSNQLTGVISAQIGSLENLETLILESNNLTGTLPQTIYQCTNLETIQLGYNSITGTLPAAIGNLNHLITFSVTHNQLSGTIPDEIYSINTLISIDLTANDFTGIIEPGIGNLTNLELLQISENQFSETIPSEIGNLVNLSYFSLFGNQFSSGLPEEITTLQNLKTLIFHDNLFDEIPELSNIDTLISCSNNHLTFEDFERNITPINSSTVQFEYIPQLTFENDTTIYITEDTPLSLSRLCGGTANHYTWWKDNTVIENDSPDLFLPSVQLSGAGDYWVTVESDIVPDLVLTSEQIHLVVEEHCIKQDSLALVALYNATDGENWNNNENWLEGNVETWFGIQGITTDGCNVTIIELSFNNLNGTIPDEICSMDQLTEINLGNNNLSSAIPTNIGQLSNLKLFAINDNQISGTIPVSLWQLKNLTKLDLRNNLLSGSISSQIGELTNLEWLDLEANMWDGTLPEEIGLLTKLEYFSIAFSPIGGTLPYEIGNLTALRYLRICKSGFYGSIPESIDQLEKLDTIEIQNCRFNNNIPDLSSLDELDYFNAANNFFLFGDIDAASVNTGSIEFSYAPQDTILHLKELYESRQITIIDDDFSGNEYHWYLNDILYEDGSDVLDLSESGMYYCLITNMAYPDLTLYSDTLYIDDIMPYYDDVVPVNLVIIDGVHPPQFLITNIGLYPDNSLLVFNRWGQKVYERSSYINDLDFSTYPEGTYYYILNYVKPDGPKLVKSFVDVVKE